LTTDGPPGSSRSLRLEDVDVELDGRKALTNIDLAVTGGDPLGLTGPSGSGKTILCLVLAGALAPTRGRLLLNGKPLTAQDRLRVGLIFQNHGLVAGLTALENVALPLQARRMGRAEIARRCSEALASVGLADESTRLVEELSGGERQRVGVARALAGDPEVVIADEPTAELDPENRERVLGLLIGPRASQRIVVVASDDPEIMMRLHSFVELTGGRVKEAGS
jgi:ABC-type lipoprotein export system ATPase subunit